ncbi:MAG: ABC transporter permease subunit [Bacteroidales bacterium]|nr:ABC transporter permease subunit [Bacteroidales bacterium]MDD2323631.1 ABC transporter permease subunit [Bacteroidales bacterium]MDD3011061.1 ABC transporter permease subunit [Bacteroidales bacterium]MDD3960420.1 ABC transporter permease subunit [Bacteroidales bacterium]MDY0285546.1 ABC transporter permease subunit [Bacteroidales bacterium]
MKQIWIIAKKELHSFFDSLMAYVMLVLFLGFTGFFTWMPSGQDIFLINQATLQPFFSIAYWTLFFFVPLLTMRGVAEEKRSGTLELLLTKPVTDWQFVSGKFLSTLLLIAVALVLTLPYYFTISRLGPIDHGAVLSGYLGLLLMSAAYTGIGIFASTVSKNQIVAVLLALLIGIFFHIIFDVLARGISGFMGEIIHYLSLSTHFESISRGVIDTKDLIYFLSIAFAGLLGSVSILSKRSLSDA